MPACTCCITDGGVVVVDTKLANWGPAILERIKSVTSKPIVTVINTHSHGDHTGSNEFFGASVESVVHENTKANMARMDAFKGDKAPAAGDEAEVVELRISEAVLKELPPIERYQSLIKLVVAAGPLLGLVGTVLGMIETFQSITESGSSDPKLMAAGIGKAMIATVLGLGIAIPLLFINSALASRSKRIIQILDEQSTGLLAETLEARAAAQAQMAAGAARG